MIYLRGLRISPRNKARPKACSPNQKNACKKNLIG